MNVTQMSGTSSALAIAVTCATAAAGETRLEGALWQIAEAEVTRGPEAALDVARARGVRLVSADRISKGGVFSAEGPDGHAAARRSAGTLIPVVLVPETNRAADLDTARIVALGCEVDAVSRSFIRALAPAGALRGLGSLPGVRIVRLPAEPIPLAVGTGDSVSESVELTGAADVQRLEVTGAGVKVGVIDLGFKGLAESISLDELPAGTVKVNLPGGHDSNLESVSDHGVAVAEQILDMAPDVTLYCLMIEDEVDFENAADYARSNGIRVVCHSIGWVNTSYYDDTGPISGTVNASYDSDGVFWTVAAGNHAQSHWRGNWLDPDANGVLNFTTDDEFMDTANASDEVSIYLNWNQYGDSQTDLDVFVYDNEGALVALSDDYQTGLQDPKEKVRFPYVPSQAPYRIQVEHFAGPTDGLGITIFSFDNDLEHAVAEESLVDPAAAHGACSVMAIDQAVWEDDDPPAEPFSSRGPTTDGRLKPDIGAPDKTSSWTKGPGAALGTSFSAPVVAGAAALIMESDPALTAADVWTQLTGAAVDVGEPGHDTTYGAGKLSMAGLGPLKLYFRVDATAPGPEHDGATWPTAFLHPQDALDVARWNSDVWVAAGTYVRREIPDASVLVLPAGVYVYGGFAGTEELRSERDLEANPTVLDGEGACLHVVVAAANARLDGVTVTGGSASGSGADATGGGLLLEDAQGFEMAQCTFTGNSAVEHGGAVAASNSGVVATDCRFDGNSAGVSAGAMATSFSNVTATGCEFTGNLAATGEAGALSIGDGTGKIEDCTFSGNSSALSAGAVTLTTSYVTLSDCVFSQNQVVSGEAGALHILSSVGMLARCEFSGNVATSSGGAVHAWGSVVGIADSEFTENSAEGGDGGAVSVLGNELRADRCVFRGNTATGSGGAICADGCGPQVTSCDFVGNAAGQGGAVYNGGSAQSIMTNCVVAGCRADSGAGVFNDAQAMPILRNCTFAGNVAAVDGGAVFNALGSNAVIVNSILVGNQPGEISGTSCKTSHCLVGDAPLGAGVIDGDPLFVAPGEWDDGGTPADSSDDVWRDGDYHLLEGSPCIDAANGDEAPQRDKDGQPRADDPGVDDTGVGDPRYVDMGAYEYEGASPKDGGGGKGGGCAAEAGGSFWLVLVAMAACLPPHRQAAARRAAKSSVNLTG